MSSQSSTMLLLTEILPHKTFGNVQLNSFEKHTILDYNIQPLFPVKCNRFCTIFPSLTKIRILQIQILKFLEPNHLNLYLCQQNLSSTKRIWNSIILPTILFPNKCITLQKLNLFQMTLIQFSLTIQILQSLMISIQNKLLRKNIVSMLL